MKKINLYTDGACSGNPGPGGWGCVLMYGENKHEKSGYDSNTTNNRMEILAVVEGLKSLKEQCDVTIYSDSSYVVNAFKQKWIEKWQLNNWKNAAKKPVKNIDLWQSLLQELEKHNCSFVWVKGHSTNIWNNRCDELATGEIEKNRN